MIPSMTSPRPIRSVTVYCSSSGSIAPVYLDGGRELGGAIATAGWTLVYGGNNVGLMGVVADAARAASGRVVGITPQLFVDKGVTDGNCHELVVCQNMRHRKALMEERGDAFVVLPGGIGTLEEFFEILVGKQLAYHQKPIVLLNLGGFFDPLVALIESGVEQKFVRPKTLGLYHLSPGVEDAVRYLQTYSPPTTLGDLSFETQRAPSAAAT